MADDRKKNPRDERPPYTKYAFLNAYNLSLLGGAGVASAATGQWWVGVGALVLESVWLLFAPDSKALQVAWFDKLWDEERKQRLTEVRDEKFKRLGGDHRQRAQTFWDVLGRIGQLAKDNPSLTADLVRAELRKLDQLYDDFLDLSLIAEKAEKHLAGIDYKDLTTLWQRYQQQLRDHPEGDKQHAIAKKNLDVLEERKRRLEELRATVDSSRGQLDLLESTARLLGDEIVSMTAPAELGARLDELRIGVSSIRETARDIDAAYAEMEDEMRAEEQRAGR